MVKFSRVFSFSFFQFCTGVFLLKHCFFKLAAVMSGVNATNYRIIFQKIITLSLTFDSLFLENRAFCCTVFVIWHLLLK